MKTALCLSGHMRTYKDTSEGLRKNLIEPLNCDVYLHTWDIRDHTPHGYYEDKHDDDFKDLAEYFDIKEIVVENQQKITAQEITPVVKEHNLHGAFHNKPEGVLCMYYKRKRVFDLVQKSGIKYDLIISTRPDILCSKTDLSSFGGLNPEDFDMNLLNLPPSDGMKLNCTEHRPSGKLIGGYGSFGGYTDIFAAGSPQKMSIFSSVYDYIVSYVSRGCPLQAERLLMTHILTNELEAREVQANFGILRDKKYEDR